MENAFGSPDKDKHLLNSWRKTDSRRPKREALLKGMKPQNGNYDMKIRKWLFRVRENECEKSTAQPM